jgi:hypothetical protein
VDRAAAAGLRASPSVSRPPLRVGSAGAVADNAFVDKRVVWIFVGVGSTVGGLAPEAWGGSALGVMSLALGLLGGLAGLWLAAKLTGY